MNNELFENLNRQTYNSLEEDIKEALQMTWSIVSFDYVCDYLKKRKLVENIDGGDICRAEIRADEVRATAYAHIRLVEDRYPQAVDAWFDVTVEEQDKYLTEAFPSTQVYGV